MKNLQEYIGEQLAHPDKGVKFEPSKLNKVGLIGAYEMLCDEYRRRLCEMWGFDIADSYWIPTDRIGEVLAICDGQYSLSMDDVRMFVERGTSYEDFSEWWEYIVTNDYGQKPCISAYSWFVLNCRPEILKDNAEHKKD